jgi:aldehyde dehydrogenase
VRCTNTKTATTTTSAASGCLPAASISTWSRPSTAGLHQGGPQHAADIDKALDAAHAAADAWGKTSATERSNILLQIADRIDANRELLAYVETIDNGKAIRETLNADIPLSADHFRYFAGAIRTQEGGISQIDNDTVAYHFHEPLGVVGRSFPGTSPS